ncbi:hypothetical protein LOD99_12580 [Oopsacas minuta]|uniref:FAD-binding PCMH-type domain-containing protein n=1 Tax=Oopsacas minuta TaxID=111878 RepID=A0AAV7JDB4_9METZ|nr:hypothetical protein LOD99_12580 [Oopsacas minuta]
MGQICTGSTRNTIAPAPQAALPPTQLPQLETVDPVDCLKVTRQSIQYVGLIQGFNMRFEANNCEVIYLPTTTDEVKQALNEVLSNTKHRHHFSIKGGGHCYENFVYNKEILAVIDLSLMNKVFKLSGCDKSYGAEAGGTNWWLVKELYRKFGLVIPGGSCYSVGLGGHICGGGYGLLSRKFGLTIDYLSGVDILCVDKDDKLELKKIRADSTDKGDQELLWACKGGGGGNFGIITCYYFENLPQSPQYAYLETLSVDWNGLDLGKFIIMLKLYWELVNNDFPYFTLLPLMHQSAGEIPLLFQSVFNQDEIYYQDKFLKFTNDLKNAGITLKSTTIPGVGHPSTKGILNIAQQLTWFEAAQTLNSSGSNQCGKYKSSYMRKHFPDDQCIALYRFLTMGNKELADLAGRFPDTTNKYYDNFVKDLATKNFVDMTQSLVQVDSYGVYINTIAPDETAIPQRDSFMKLQYQTYWKRAPVPKSIIEMNEIEIPYDSFNAFQDWIHILWINQMFKEVYSKTGGVPDPYYIPGELREDGGATNTKPKSSCANPTIPLDPDRIVDGCYYNYIDTEMIDVIRHEYGVNEHEAKEAVLRLYFEDNLDKLVSTKSASDPQNIFKHNLSIPVSMKLNQDQPETVTPAD